MEIQEPLFIKKIDLLRDALGNFFDHDGNENLTFCNYGTGTGKTYSVISNFVKNQNTANPLHNLVFIAPQKNQLPLDETFVKLAQKNGVALLWAKAESDLYDMETNLFYNGTTYYSNAYWLTNLALYNYINNQNKLDKRSIRQDDKIILEHWKTHSKRTFEEESAPSICGLINAFENLTQINQEEHPKNQEDIEDQQKRKKRAERQYCSKLKQLTEFFLKYYTDQQFKEIIDRSVLGSEHTSPMEYLAFRLIGHVAPFEIAKHKKSIICMTGDKARYNLLLSETQNGKKKVVQKKLQEIISGTQISSEFSVASYLHKNNDEFFMNLKSDFFEQNSDNNYFIQNNIGFSVVFDEEHNLSNKLNKNSWKNITTAEENDENQLNILHAMAGISRWFNQTKTAPISETLLAETRKEKNAIVQDIRTHIKAYTNFQTDEQINQLFDSFAENTSWTSFILKEDYEIINAVCSQILTFSPKFISNNDMLEGIKLISGGGQHYFTKSKELIETFNVSCSLTDFFKVVMIVLYTCRDASSKLQKEEKISKNTDSQNAPIYNLLQIAKANKHYLENLFNTDLNISRKQKLNYAFTYFLKKIGFQIEINKAQDKDYQGNLSVTPVVFVINELPEVQILQILQNPRNKVFLLSATRGFQEIYSGNFSTPFFECIEREWNECVRIKRQTKEEYIQMADFTQARFESREELTISSLILEDGHEGNYVLTTYQPKNLDFSDTMDISETTIKGNLNQENPNIDFKMLGKANAFIEKAQLISFRKKEIQTVQKIIKHVVSQPYLKQHSIIMTLTNEFKSLMNNAYASRVLSGWKTPDFAANNPILARSIFDIQVNPFQHIRLICYSAELSKQANFQKAFHVDQATTIVLVSSFQSAGTGLNFTVTVEGTDNQDFGSIYLLSDPYYSTVKTSTDGNFLNIPNEILLMKKATEDGDKTLEYIEQVAIGQEGQHTLLQEHNMERCKTIIQALGRIERRDYRVATQIYVVDTSERNFENFTHLYYQTFIYNQHTPNSVIHNFSMINRAFLKVSIYLQEKHQLSDVERMDLEQNSLAANKVYQDFFENSGDYNYRGIMNKHRQQDPNFGQWVIAFNNIIRKYSHPEYDFKQQLTEFLTQAVIPNGVRVKIKKLINYAEIPNVYPGKPIYFDHYNRKYTDCKSIEPTSLVDDNMIFNHWKNLPNHLQIERNNWLKQFIEKSTSTALTKIPNPYLLNIIKGNIGEALFEDWFKYSSARKKYKGIESFDISIQCALFELFDIYLYDDSNKRLICIDIKNWSFKHDSAAKKAIERIQHKQSIVQQYIDTNIIKVDYVYLNMSLQLDESYIEGFGLHLNTHKLKNSHIHAFNFIKIDPQYKETKDYTLKKEDKDFVSINPQFLRFLD